MTANKYYEENTMNWKVKLENKTPKQCWLEYSLNGGESEFFLPLNYLYNYLNPLHLFGSKDFSITNCHNWSFKLIIIFYVAFH